MELVPFAEDPWGHLGILVISSLILGTALSASTMRLTRTLMLEELRQDYIRTAAENAQNKGAFKIIRKMARANRLFLASAYRSMPATASGISVVRKTFRADQFISG